MVHAIPGGIIRVNEGDAILSFIYLYRPKIPSGIDGPSGMFAVGEEEESPLTMFAPVLPFIRNQTIYSRFHIKEVTLQMGIPF